MPVVWPATALGETVPAATLRIVKRSLDVDGKAATVFGLVATNGRPGLSLATAERSAVRLVNETNEPTIIHWHGLTQRWQRDGLAADPSPLIGPGATRDFEFRLTTAGTNWIHADTLQEQMLLAAPLIITEGKSGSDDDQEIVVLLHDFSFKSPEELLGELKQKGGRLTNGRHHDGMARTTHGSMDGLSRGRMRGAGTASDVNEIDYDAYLANDRTLKDPEIVRVERGGRVRLRLINAATATVFILDLEALQGELVAVDGLPVKPIRARRFSFAMGQRLDVRLVLPAREGCHPILFAREGEHERTGIVLATPNAHVQKFAPTDDRAAPVMGLQLETMLTADKPLAARTAARTVAIELIGDTTDYQWGLGGLEQPLLVNVGERIELAMTNSSPLAHPMHLQGHHFQVVAVNGRRIDGAVRDTVHIPPNANATIAFDADNPGRWTFHCHNLYRTASGMRGFVQYAGIG